MKKYTSRNQSIERAVDILSLLTDEQREWTPTEMARRLGLNAGTTQRLMQTLEYRGMLEQDPVTSRYRIGLQAFRIGRNYLAHDLLERNALPVLEALADGASNEVHLAYLDADAGEIVMIFTQQGRRILRLSPGKGMVRGPAHTTALGKAIMAYMDDPLKLERVFSRLVFKKYTEHSIPSLTVLKKELKAIRDRGYAVDDRESGAHIRCVAAPVFNHLGAVTAAVSVSGYEEDVTPAAVPGIARKVRTAATAVSRKMGAPDYVP